MNKLSYINKEKSIQTGRLVSKTDWTTYLDKFFFCIISASFVLDGTLIELEFPNDGLFTEVLLYFIAPAFIILGLYCIYRKVRENELILVQTHLTKHKNLLALKEYLKKYNYTIDQENDDIIIVIDEYMLSFNGLWRKKYVFLIDDYVVYFNITKLFPFIAPPVLISHLTLKYDLKKLFSSL